MSDELKKHPLISILSLLYGLDRTVLGLPRHIEVLEGDELREFLRENAEFILKK